MFTIEISGDLDSEKAGNEPGKDVEIVEPCISINALSGNQSFNTTRIRGVVTKNPLHILVDLGSTHNFLDISYAKKIRCMLKDISTQAVAVADGNHISCQHIRMQFRWEMNRVEFSADVMVIQLGSCDMVLEIQWLSTLVPLFWDFKKLVMEFAIDGERVQLKGIPTQEMKVVGDGPSIKAMENAAQLCLLQVYKMITQWNFAVQK